MKWQFRSKGKRADHISFSKARGGSLNRDPAALMANKGQYDRLSRQDALCRQERQGPCGLTLFLPQALWKRARHRAVSLHGAAHLLGVSQCEDAVSSSGPIWGEFLAHSEDSARSNRWATSRMAREHSAVPLTDSKKRNNRRRCPRRALQKFDHRRGAIVFGNKQATWEELEDSWLFQYNYWKLQAEYQHFFIQWLDKPFEATTTLIS